MDLNWTVGVGARDLVGVAEAFAGVGTGRCAGGTRVVSAKLLTCVLRVCIARGCLETDERAGMEFRGKLG